MESNCSTYIWVPRAFLPDCAVYHRKRVSRLRCWNGGRKPSADSVTSGENGKHWKPVSRRSEKSSRSSKRSRLRLVPRKLPVKNLWPTVAKPWLAAAAPIRAKGSSLPESSTGVSMAKTPNASPKPPLSLKEINDKGSEAGEVWDLRLYVAGQTPRSVAAFANLKKICEEHLAGRYNIEVVDLLKHPQLAAGDQILAIPTLVRKLPQPLRKIVGDLRDTERALVGLQLRPAGLEK